MTRQRRARGAASVVGLAFLMSCGVPTDERATVIKDADVPFGLLAPSTTTTTVAPTVTEPTRPGQLCFVRDGMLSTVIRQLPLSGDLATVSAALVGGPNPDESGAGLRSSIVGAELLGSVTLTGGVARVDLGPGFSTITGTEQLLALGQLVCTLTAQPGVGQVAFTLAGQPVEVPRGDGSLTSAPVSRDDYSGLVGPSLDSTTTTTTTTG